MPDSRPPQLALCRCGGSAIRPLCDRACARNGFTDAKDPNRVPDRRDTYQGQQVTIFDNRGICQHSGYCTDRLGAVFRAGEEPFVAPSGGRLDEMHWYVGFRDPVPPPGYEPTVFEWAGGTTALTRMGSGNADLPALVPSWDWGPGGPPSVEPEAGEEAAAPPLPGPDEPVGFEAHIRPLFRERDRQSMSFAFDLWSYDDVRVHAGEILDRAGNGSIWQGYGPPDAPAWRGPIAVRT